MHTSWQDVSLGTFCTSPCRTDLRFFFFAGLVQNTDIGFFLLIEINKSDKNAEQTLDQGWFDSGWKDRSVELEFQECH